ncbi:hypothetical protein KUV40_01850 [Marinobacter hydrocarbonoclasticus]|nr:hypothetical protein [Marinobacter nauticus]MBY6219726.1 hypothetical protein [Marinobacter nauticus]
MNDLMDVASPSAIVLGRTGSGKSALLYKLEKSTEKSIRLDPNDISIRFLEHSDIIQFFDELGIKLDLFYRLLWRHLITVEFLKLRYDIKCEEDGKAFSTGVLSRFSRDKARKKSLEYFNEWGSRFWLDTDEQLREITSKLERDTKGVIGAKYFGVDLSVEGVKRLSDEQRTEITQRARQVVSGLQIRKLNEVLDLLSEYSFDDPQKKYYVLIDQLDEDWANTETRCRFIRALIEEIKTFRKLKTVKIIAALRKDLLDLVFDRTRDSGFQEEKYESYILDIRWSESELSDLVSLRVNEVFKSKYTNDRVSFDDVFPKPKKGGGQAAIDFILERTLRRPRDVLQFVNESLKIAEDRDRISWRALTAAEAQYSAKRLKSLKEEWSEFFPSFEDTVEILRGLTADFTRTSIKDGRLEDVMMILHDQSSSDPCVEVVQKFYGGKSVKESDVLSTFLICLYRVGAIGVKISSIDTFLWSFVDQSTISKGEVKRANKIKIHKMLYRALDVIVDVNDVFVR